MPKKEKHDYKCPKCGSLETRGFKAVMVHCKNCSHQMKKPEDNYIGPHEPDAPQKYGQWKTFRDFVDAMGDLFKPENLYIYEKFAVFDFRWTIDSKKMHDYLENRSAKCYTGIHFDQDSYMMVTIDVADGEG